MGAPLASVIMAAMQATDVIVVYDSGQAIVMPNSDNGGELVQEIVRSIAKEYGWLDYPFD
jgi:hypothetical protein